jgi:hypothetical protein
MRLVAPLQGRMWARTAPRYRQECLRYLAVAKVFGVGVGVAEIVVDEDGGLAG